MSEALWLAASDLGDLWALVPNQRERKMRLFACACCRRMWSLLAQSDRGFVELAERYVDGEATSDEFRAATTAFPEGAERYPIAFTRDDLASNAAEITLTPYHDDLDLASQNAADAVFEQHRKSLLPEDAKRVWVDERSAHAGFLRDIFGNPFRPVTFDPAWRTSDAVALVRQMYESREFDAMPILADALQDAGCDNEDVLNHCRADGPHVRGCWVIDLVLGKL